MIPMQTSISPSKTTKLLLILPSYLHPAPSLRQCLNMENSAPEFDNGTAEALFVAADKYRVDALKDICEDYLVSTLSIENVIHYLVWGHVYLALKLKAAAIVYLVYHRYKIWNRQEWKELRRTYTDLYDEACDRMFNCFIGALKVNKNFNG
jgi:hypothetical protein